MMKSFLYPEGHQNCISSSKVTVILMKGLILPAGGASAREGLRMQPAQLACFMKIYSPGLSALDGLGEKHLDI